MSKYFVPAVNMFISSRAKTKRIPKVNKARMVVKTTTVNIKVKYFCMLDMMVTANYIFLEEKRMSGNMIIYAANKIYARLDISSTL